MALCGAEQTKKHVKPTKHTHVYMQFGPGPNSYKRSSKIRLPIGLPCCAVLCSAFPTAAAEAKAIAEAEAAKEKEAAEAKCFPKQDVFYTAQHSTAEHNR